jgi:serine/threonine protein kinase
MRKCSVCGSLSRSNQTRCPSCGTPLLRGLFATELPKYDPPEVPLRSEPVSSPSTRQNRRRSQSEEPVRIIGQRYRIIKPLGGGGMKEVYLAEDLRLANRPCALAEIIEDPWNPQEQYAFAQAFAREASILALLKHPRIPHVYDHFSEHDHHFLVMEYVEGETLEYRLKASPNGFLDENFVIYVALQVLEALEYLHSRTPAVIFRDLKPSNLMISKDGSVKVIDFGIARLFVSQKTATMVGTHGYAPPEQYEGRTEPRTDLYALGATMLNLLTGWDPAAHAPFSFPALRQLRQECSQALEEIISQALMIDPDDRISTAREFAHRLKAVRAADAMESSASVGARTVHNESPATVASILAPATLSMTGDEPTRVFTHQITCRLCSRQIPQDAPACPYCLMIFQPTPKPDSSRVWLVASLVFTSLLSVALGIAFFVQHENARTVAPAKPVAKPAQIAHNTAAQPTEPSGAAMLADKMAIRNVEQALSVREKMLCDRVGTGARLLTIVAGKGSDARNISSLSHRLLALLDGTSVTEQNLLKHAFKIIISDVRLNPDWTPEEEADMWRGTCRAERWPTTNAQERLLRPASLTRAAPQLSTSSPAAAQGFRTSGRSEPSAETARAAALKYFCANAMIEQISQTTSEQSNELSRESYRELARELGITEDQARSEFVQMIHYYGSYEGAAQACAAEGWLPANP